MNTRISPYISRYVLRIALLFISVSTITIGFSQTQRNVIIDNNDLVYLESRDRILFSTPSGDSLTGSSLCLLNPYFGTIDTCYFIPGVPRAIALSADEAYCYAGLKDSAQIIRFNLTTDTIDQRIEVGLGRTNRPLYVEDIAVFPDNNESIIVSRFTQFSPEGVAIFDNGIQRPWDLNNNTVDMDFLAYVPNVNKWFSYNDNSTAHHLTELLVQDSGLVQGTTLLRIVTGFDAYIKGQDKYIYGADGTKVDVSGDSAVSIASYPMLNVGRAVVPSRDSNYVYFVHHELDLSVVLTTVEKDSFNVVAKKELENISGIFQDLIEWGYDDLKLAFSTREMIVLLWECESLITEPLVLPHMINGGCWGDKVTIKAPPGYNAYYWNNGATTDSITVGGAADFYVRVADSLGCLSNPSNVTSVRFSSPPSTPTINGGDTVNFCQGEQFILNLSISSTIDSIIWSDGVTERTREVDSPGVYWVVGFSSTNCPSDTSDLVIVEIHPDSIPPQPILSITEDTFICKDSSVTISGPDGYDKYIWSSGENTQSIDVAFPNVLSLVVENSLGCRSPESERIRVRLRVPPAKPVIEANGDILSATSTNDNEWYLNDTLLVGESGEEILAMESGIYKVRTRELGCWSEFSDNFQHILVNINDVTQDHLFGHPYPNPAKEVFYINATSQLDGMLTLELFNGLGKIIRTQHLRNSNSVYAVNVSDLISGYYKIRIRNDRNEVIYFSSVVVY